MTTESRFQTAIPLLKDLIQINSINPTLAPGGSGERQIAEYLHAYLLRQGVSCDIQDLGMNRFNIVAKVKGRKKGPRILWCGHLDTVGVEGMQAPFDPLESLGKIYGRGSQDMKGGLASAIAALTALSHDRDNLPGEIILAGVADEEDRSLGIEHFLHSHPKNEPVDLALVLEPTDLKVCSAHKGFAWLEVQVEGKAAHGSRPKEGIDAIRQMGRLLERLDHLDQHLQTTPLDPLLGSGSLHTSFISGGREWSSYPDRCVLRYERRTVPPENEATVRGELDLLLENLSQTDAAFRGKGELVFSRAPFQQDRNHPLVRRFRDLAVLQLSGLADWGTVSFWTDAALIAAAGIPCLVFGPRGAGLHSREEYVLASDVTDCAAFLYRSAHVLSRHN